MGLGSVSNLTDSTGKVQATYSYDAWGNTLVAKGNVGTQNKFRYTAQALDPGDLGWYFLSTRYADHRKVWAITEQIPILAGSARLPVTLNRYSYAGNNPADFVYLSRKFAPLPWLIACAASEACVGALVAAGTAGLEWALCQENGEVPDSSNGFYGTLIAAGSKFLPGNHHCPKLPAPPPPPPACPVNPIPSAASSPAAPGPSPAPLPAPLATPAPAPQVPVTPPTLTIPRS